MFNNLIQHILNSGSNQRAIAIILIILSLFLSGYVLAQQDRLDTKKADVITIEQMLEQNRQLIELQRQAQQLQMAEIRRLEIESSERFRALEREVFATQNRIHVNEVQAEATADAILNKLDSLNEQIIKLADDLKRN